MRRRNVIKWYRTYFLFLNYGGIYLESKQNISKSKLLITQQEMVLIKNSEEAKNISIYGNLYDCLETYKKLSKIELEKNLVFDEMARAVLLNRDNKKVMMDNISNEWYSITHYNISEVEMHCQLCGHRNKIICYIKNRITGVELHIGSECVTNYSNIDGLKQEMKRVSNLIKEREMQRRKIEFEAREGADAEFLEKAQKDFEKFPVMLPLKLQTEMNDTLQQLKLAKKSYIKSGGNLENVYCTYNLLKSKYNDLYNKADEHYNKVKYSILACDIDTANWLSSNNTIIYESVAKNNGMLNVDTLKKVYYENFVKIRLDAISKHLSDQDIKILEVKGKVIRCAIYNTRYTSTITFTITIKVFMEKIGCYCLTDPNYKFGKSDFQDIVIEYTPNNYEALYNSVCDFLQENGYDFIIEDKSLQAYWKKLPYYEKKNRWSNGNQIEAMYKKSDIETFLATFSPFLLRDEMVMIKNFDYISKKMGCGKSWITQKEKNMQEQITRQARGYQKQREFTPY